MEKRLVLVALLMCGRAASGRAQTCCSGANCHCTANPALPCCPGTFCGIEGDCVADGAARATHTSAPPLAAPGRAATHAPASGSARPSNSNAAAVVQVPLLCNGEGQTAACTELAKANDAAAQCANVESDRLGCYDRAQCLRNMAIAADQYSHSCPGDFCEIAKRQLNQAKTCGQSHVFSWTRSLRWTFPGHRYTADGDFALIEAHVDERGYWGGSFEATNNSLWQNSYDIQFTWGHCEHLDACTRQNFEPIFSGLITDCFPAAGFHNKCEATKTQPWGTPKGTVAVPVRDRFDRINVVFAQFRENIDRGDPYDGEPAPVAAAPAPRHTAPAAPVVKNCTLPGHQYPGCFNGAVGAFYDPGCATNCVPGSHGVCVDDQCTGNAFIHSVCGCTPGAQ